MTVVTDQFPNDVTVPVDGERVTYRLVRLLISGHEARLLGMLAGVPTVMASGTVVGTPPFPTRQVSTLATEDGEWFVDRSPGCGCHHPLKRLPREDALAAAGLS